ncbi:hypothetical protein [Desulfosporosinus fructosivorans]
MKSRQRRRVGNKDVSNRQLSQGWRIAGHSSELAAFLVSLVYAASGANVVNQTPELP